MRSQYAKLMLVLVACVMLVTYSIHGYKLVAEQGSEVSASGEEVNTSETSTEPDGSKGDTTIDDLSVSGTIEGNYYKNGDTIYTDDATISIEVTVNKEGVSLSSFDLNTEENLKAEPKEEETTTEPSGGDAEDGESTSPKEGEDGESTTPKDGEGGDSTSPENGEDDSSTTPEDGETTTTEEEGSDTTSKGNDVDENGETTTTEPSLEKDSEDSSETTSTGGSEDLEDSDGETTTTSEDNDGGDDSDNGDNGETTTTEDGNDGGGDGGDGGDLGDENETTTPEDSKEDEASKPLFSSESGTATTELPLYQGKLVIVYHMSDGSTIVQDASEIWSELVGVTYVTKDTEAPEITFEGFSGEMQEDAELPYIIKDGILSFKATDKETEVDNDTWTIEVDDETWEKNQGRCIYNNQTECFEVASTFFSDGETEAVISVKDVMGNKVEEYSFVVRKLLKKDMYYLSGNSIANPDYNTTFYICIRDDITYINKPLELYIDGTDSEWLKSIELLKDGELYQEVDYLGYITISDTGNYSFRYTNIYGHTTTCSLKDVMDRGRDTQGIVTSDIVLDDENPTISITLNGEELYGYYYPESPSLTTKHWLKDEAKITVTIKDNIGLGFATVSIGSYTYPMPEDYWQNIYKEYSFELDLKRDEVHGYSGGYAITVYVQDLATNKIYPTYETIYADFNDPEVTNWDTTINGDITYKRDSQGKATGAYLKGDLTINSVDVKDEESGYKGITIYKNGEYLTGKVPYTIKDEGTYTVKVSDKSGRSTTYTLEEIFGLETSTILTDDVPPVISRVDGFKPDLVLSGINFIKEPKALSWRVTDDFLEDVEFTINGTRTSNYSITEGVYTVDIEGRNGIITVGVTAKDKYNNVSRDSFTYSTDKTAPSNLSASLNTTDYTYRFGTWFFKTTPTVNIKAKDDGVGVDRYYLDGLNGTGSQVSPSNSTGTNGVNFSIGTGSYAVRVSDRFENISNTVNLGTLLGESGNDFLVDGTEPRISGSKPNTGVNNYYASDITYNIHITDDIGLWRASVSINGTVIDSFSADEKGIKSVDLNASTAKATVDENGRYTVTVTAVDNAGNRSSWTDYIIMDKHKPTVDSFTFTGDGVVEGSTGNGSKRYGLYFKGNASVSIAVSDGEVSSGLDKLYVTVETEDGAVSESVYDCSDGVVSFSLPSNFKGYISAYAVDNVGNKGNANRPDGIVSGDSNWYLNSLKVNLTIPKTEYKDGKGHNLYNGDIVASLSVEDKLSGIKQIEWGTGEYGETSLGKVTVDARGNISDKSIKTYKEDGNLVINISKDINAIGNANDIVLWVMVTDRGGNVSRTRKVFSIDKDKPVINIAYDSGDGKYFNKTKSATLTITERNFDPSKVEISGVKGEVSSWVSSGNTHTIKMQFIRDNDYTFTVKCVDFAGNESNTLRSKDFTIDKTLPRVTVLWNTGNALNGNYYSTSRTATVTIREKNFDSSLVTISGSGSRGSWVNNGELHTITVSFTANGNHNFGVVCKDLAGNSSDTYKAEGFIIDTVTPSIVVDGVENGVSYKKDVSLVVNLSDTNIDKANSYVTLYGKRNKNIVLSGSMGTSSGRFEITSFPVEEQYDDIYTLTVRLEDKAGNHIEKELVFSINRFGSKFNFEDSDLLNQYLASPRDISITESNIDKLAVKDLRVSVIKDGSELGLTEDQLSVKEVVKNGKYTYTYTVDKGVFAEDGKYIIQVYSKAKDGTDYNTLDKEYSFVVDTTAPEIIISGVESNKQYNDYSRNVSLDIRDSSGVGNLRVLLNNKEISLNKRDSLYMFDVKEAEDVQNLDITVIDMAGNISNATVVNFLISSNSWLFIINQLWFKLSILGIILFILLIIILIVYSRHKVKKTERRNLAEQRMLYQQAASSSSSSGSIKDMVEELDSEE